MRVRPEPPAGDGPLQRLLRRAVTMPAFLLGLLAWSALLPVLLYRANRPAGVAERLERYGQVFHVATLPERTATRR